MKKITAFLMAAALLLGSAAFTACGSTADDPQDASSAVTNTVPSETPAEDSSSGASEVDEKPKDEKPKKETYGAIVEEDGIKYRLVNREFYEAVGLVMFDEIGINLTDTEKSPFLDLRIPSKVGKKPVQRIRGELDFDAAEKVDFFDFNGYEGAFANDSRLRSVQISEGITNIGFGAFHRCPNLLVVSLPASLVSFDKDPNGSINYPPFYRCSSLESISVVKGNTAFKSVDGVLFTADGETLLQYPAGKEETSYTVPEGVKTIGAYAFDGCTQLTEIVLSESVETVEEYAFSDCKTLETVKISKNVTQIGFNAFYSCTALTAISVDNGSTAYKSIDGVLFDKSGETLVFYPCTKTESEYTVPSGVKTIGHLAFDSGESLKKLTLPKSLETIEYNDFDKTLEEFVVEEGCKAYKSLDGVLYDGTVETMLYYPRAKTDEVLRIPDGVTKLDSWALGYFDNLLLKKVIFPASMGGVEEFYGIPGDLLESIEVEEGNTSYKSVEGVLFTADGETLLQYPIAKKDASFTVPEGVKTIPERAGLMYNVYLKKISLPASLEKMNAEYAGIIEILFNDALEEIVVAEGCKAYSSADGMLLNGDGTTLLFYPTSAKASEVTLPEGIKTIGEEAFRNPANLKILRLPESLRTIKRRAIESEALEELYIPAGVHTIYGGGVIVSHQCRVCCEAQSQPGGWENYWRYDLDTEDYSDLEDPTIWGKE